MKVSIQNRTIKISSEGFTRFYSNVDLVKAFELFTTEIRLTQGN